MGGRITMAGPGEWQFTPGWWSTDLPHPDITDGDIANEPMLFSSDFDFAVANGGPLTKHCLTAIGKADPYWLTRVYPGAHVVIDTRAHMLMPGMLPAIPGWHCDALPRQAGGQPDLSAFDGRVEHYTVTLAVGDVSQTEFSTQDVTARVGPDRPVWAQVHESVPLKSSIGIPHGWVCRFGHGDLHRATPSKGQGWRFFLRASIYPSTPRNQIRRQVQAYVLAEGAGW